MSYAQYEAFVATFENGSFAAAARALYKTPEAISKQVRNLEEKLNVDLIETDKKKTVFTPEASNVYQLCKNALKAENDLCEYAQRSRHSGITNLTIAVAFQPARGALFPKKVKGLFEKCFPEINLDVRQIPNSECINAVKSGIADAAFTLRPEREDIATVCDIFAFKPLLLVGKQDSLAKRDCLTADDLEGKAFAFPVDIGIFYGQFRSYLEKISNPKIENPGYTLEKHRDFIKNGGCVFVTPDERLKSVYPDGAFLNLKDFDKELVVSLILKDPNSPQALLLKDFSIMLKEHIRKD